MFTSQAKMYIYVFMRIVLKRNQSLTNTRINSIHTTNHPTEKYVVVVRITVELPEWIGQFKRKWTHAYQCSSSNQKFKNWENTEGVREFMGTDRLIVLYSQWIKLNFWFSGTWSKNSFELHQSYPNAMSSNDAVCVA